MLCKLIEFLTDFDFAGNSEHMSGPGRGRGMSGKEHSSREREHKPTRVRTVLNEKQLHTLRTCYAANPRPDALMKVREIRECPRICMMMSYLLCRVGW